MNATPAFEDPSSSLMTQIQNKIKTQGPLSFSDYMGIALYDPKCGYYATPRQTVGKHGDFITSVSIGRCFGMILAHRLLTYWQQSEHQGPFHIIEPGAHDGSLCADILSEIQQQSPEFYETVHYHLIDATPALAQAQQEKLNPSFEGKFTTHKHINEIHNFAGALISNELIDAFPVELIQWNDHSWWQMMVSLSANLQLTMTPAEINTPQLAQFCQSLGTAFPNGYTTEYNPGIEPFTRDASQALQAGLFITIDYGHSTEDYYHPDRTSGTLQTYHQHQKSGRSITHARRNRYHDPH